MREKVGGGRRRKGIRERGRKRRLERKGRCERCVEGTGEGRRERKSGKTAEEWLARAGMWEGGEE